MAKWIQAARQAQGVVRDQQVMAYSSEQQACIKAMLRDMFRVCDYLLNARSMLTMCFQQANADCVCLSVCLLCV